MPFTSRSVIDRTISFTSNKFDKYNKKKTFFESIGALLV